MASQRHLQRQKAIVLPAMTPIMPRPVIAKGNLFPRFYEEFAHQPITLREEVCMAFRALTPLTLAAVTLLSGCSMFRSYDTEIGRAHV